jgi:uncharacterized protein YndB with AHSA1/START domain
MTSRVVLSLRIEATPLAVFEAFTRDIGEWWVHDDAFRFTPRSPGRLSFEPPGADGAGGRLVETLPGGKVFEIGQVSVWAPGERLVVSWRQATFGPDHATEVDVRFEPVGQETRVTLEHRGWDSVPMSHVARHGMPLTTFLSWQGRQWRNGLEHLRRIVAD